MNNSTLLATTLILLSSLLISCNDQPNPLIGHWQQVPTTTEETGKTVEFTPSTMRIGDTRVTVVYQIRKNKVRVSASKNEMIYDVLDKDSIQYQDKQQGLTKLVRYKPE
jgi:hypothetical protein